MEQSTKFFNQIPVSIIEANDLNDFEKLLFSEIYTMANSFGSVFPSNNFLADRYGKSKKTISVTLKSLQEKEYIKLEYEYEGKEIKRRYILPYLHKCKGGIYTDVNTLIHERKEGIYKNVKDNISTNKSINISNNNMSGKPDDVIPYSEILSYLNKKTGRSFRNVEANKKLIKARWNEGYKLEDFKTVVDNMVSNWSGKMFNGVQAENYLQPKTLFSNKFDNYLNQTQIKSSANTGGKNAPEWSNPKTLKDREYMTDEEVEALINGLGNS